MEDNNGASQVPPSPEVPPSSQVPPQQPAQPAVTPLEMDNDARNMGMLAHLLALAGFLFPFGNIIGPLVIWLMKKDQMPFVDDQGKEALNFQITLTIAYLIASASMLICIGFILLPAVLLFGIISVIIAAMKAKEGIRYRYPYTLRLIK